jgi:phage baseplate assembly protein W
MPFGVKQIFPSDLDNNQAIGIDLPLNGEAVFKPNYQTKDAIKSNLINFFLTNPGERYLNPTFGGGLRNFVFEQINNDNLDFLRKDINQKVQLSFPNIDIKDLTITGNNDLNQVKINLTYSIKNTNIKDELNIEL